MHLYFEIWNQPTSCPSLPLPALASMHPCGHVLIRTAVQSSQRGQNKALGPPRASPWIAILPELLAIGVRLAFKDAGDGRIQVHCWRTQWKQQQLTSPIKPMFHLSANMWQLKNSELYALLESKPPSSLPLAFWRTWESTQVTQWLNKYWLTVSTVTNSCCSFLKCIISMGRLLSLSGVNLKEHSVLCAQCF